MNEYRQVWVTARPARIATFIDADDEWWPSYVRNILRAYTLSWGGWGNVIVPYSAQGLDRLFIELLEAYDPDYICLYEKTGMDLNANEPAAYDDWLERYRVSAEKSGVTWDEKRARSDLDAAPLLDYSAVRKTLNEQLADRVWPFHYPGHGLLALYGLTANGGATGHLVPLSSLAHFDMRGRTLTRFTFNNLAPLVQLGLETVYGVSDSSLGKLPILCSWEDRLLTGANSTEAFGLLWQKEYRLTALWKGPFAVSLNGLSMFPDPRFPGETGVTMPILVVLGDTCTDYCLYSVLSKMYPNTIWIPASHASLVQARCFAGTRLGGYIDEAVREATGEQARLASASWQEAERQDFAANWDSLYGDPAQLPMNPASAPVFDNASIANAYVGSNVKKMLPFIVRLHQEIGSGRSRRMCFSDGECIEEVNTPIPECLVGLKSSGIQTSRPEWLVTATIDGMTVPGSSSVPDLFASFARSLKSPHEGYRSSTSGIHYKPLRELQLYGSPFTEQLDFPILKLPPSEQVLMTLLGDRGLRLSASDKGRYTRQTTGLFGGLQELVGVLQSAEKRQLLEILSCDKDQNKYPGLFISGRKRRALVYENIRDIVGEDLTARELIDDWLAAGILRQGAVLKCAECSQTDWYPLDLLHDENRCSRCGASLKVNPSSMPYSESLGAGAPYFAYIMAEVIVQFVQQQSHFVAVTLASLAERARSFLYIPETEIAQPKMELDFVALREGALVLGEVKSGKKENLSKKAVDRLFRLAGKAGASAVVFASIDAPSPCVAGNIASNTQRHSIDAIQLLIDTGSMRAKRL